MPRTKETRNFSGSVFKREINKRRQADHRLGRAQKI
jgi:hypothetical protein